MERQRMRTQVRSEDGTRTDAPVPEGFVVRAGDVLVVGYPEVTLPLKEKFAILKVGGCSYSRTLREGDDVNEQWSKISTWLAKVVEEDARRKARSYNEDLQGRG